MVAYGLVVLLLGLACTPRSEPAEQAASGSSAKQGGAEAGDHERRALSLVDELAAMGFDIDLDSLSIEVSDLEDCVADVDRQQDMFFPESYFTGLHMFLECLGLSSESPEALRKVAVTTVLQQMSAYYQADRQTLVFPRSRLNGLMEGLGQVDYLLAHELVHAYQDQQLGGLVELLSATGRNREQIDIARCLIEGQSEAVAMALVLNREGQTLQNVDAAMLDMVADVEQMLSGSAQIYDAGRRLVLSTAQAQGWAGVDDLFAHRPTSTEQILHPEKRGKDLPSLPERSPWKKLWPDGELVHEDVMGELSLSMLLGAVLSPAQGYIAATGWDGDRLVVVRTADGELLAHWRSVWDREEDARQFADAVAAAGGATLAVDGRVVDAFAGPDWHQGAWASALSDGNGVARPADAASTAAAEAAQRVATARREGDRWIRPDVGVSMVVTPSFSESAVRGMPVLLADTVVTEGQFSSNITALRLANTLGDDLDVLEQLNREQFEAMPGTVLKKMEQTVIGGQPALAYDVSGTFVGGLDLLLFGLLIPDGEYQIVITATLANGGSDSLEAEAREILASVQLLENE